MAIPHGPLSGNPARKSWLYRRINKHVFRGAAKLLGCLEREIPRYAGLLGSGPTLQERRKGTMMRQDLQAIQKEARGLLRALQQNDFATTRLYRHSDVVEGNFHARLADAQYIVARRYGFKSWANLKDSVSPRRTEIPTKFTTPARYFGSGTDSSDKHDKSELTSPNVVWANTA
jgi:hypothetical protein